MTPQMDVSPFSILARNTLEGACAAYKAVFGHDVPPELLEQWQAAWTDRAQQPIALRDCEIQPLVPEPHGAVVARLRQSFGQLKR